MPSSKRRKAAEMTPRELADKLRRQYGDAAERVACDRADAAATHETASAYVRALDVLGQRRK